MLALRHLMLGSALISGVMMGSPVRAADTINPSDAELAEAKAAKKPGTAYFRVLHAIGDGPRVDVYIDGKKTLKDVAFKTLSSYLPVANGEHSIAVNETGKVEALFSDKKVAVANSFYTLVIATTAGKPALFPQNESSGNLVQDKARIRMYHLSPGAPPVEVTLPAKRNTKDQKVQITYSRLFDDPVAYKKVQSRLLSPGTYTLQVRAEGQVLKELTGVQVEAGKRYAIFALGKPGQTGANAFDIVVAPAAIR
jgi:hypothetical protein